MGTFAHDGGIPLAELLHKFPGSPEDVESLGLQV